MINTRTWRPEDAALADLVLSELTEDGEDTITIDIDLLGKMMAAMSTALTLALVDPAWATRLMDRFLTGFAANNGMTLEQARLEEWAAARAYIAEHPMPE